MYFTGGGVRVANSDVEVSTVHGAYRMRMTSDHGLSGLHYCSMHYLLYVACMDTL